MLADKFLFIYFAKEKTKPLAYLVRNYFLSDFCGAMHFSHTLQFIPAARKIMW